MSWLIYLGISVVGGGVIAVLGTWSTRAWARIIWQHFRSTMIEQAVWHSDGRSRHYELVEQRSGLYDDSSYKHRDTPHVDDYVGAVMLTLVFFVSWPYHGMQLYLARCKARRVAAWKEDKAKRAIEARERLARQAEADKIVAELQRPKGGLS